MIRVGKKMNNKSQEIKSQHELSEQGRQSEVLIKAIEKCEKLEKQLKIAVNGINESIKDYEINGACYEDCVGFYMNATLIKTLEQIKELDK
jgi:hypothetical protein